MNDQLKKEITATFDDDTRKCNRFPIDEGQCIKGMVYIPKDEEVPGILIIRLRTK